MNAAVLVSVAFSHKQRGYRASSGVGARFPQLTMVKRGWLTPLSHGRPHLWTTMWTVVYLILHGSASDYIGSEM